MAQHFAQHLEALRADVARMTAKVQRVVEQSTEALIHRDIALAQQAIEADKLVDRDEVAVEQNAIRLLALYQPAAADLRFITSVIKVTNDFERIADCAVNVAQRVPSIARQREMVLPRALVEMANSVVEILRTTINAFNLSNVELAKHVIRSDDRHDALYHQIVQDTLQTFGIRAADGEDVVDRHSPDPSRDLALIMTAKNYERIGDHCSNVAEDILYIVSGNIIRHLHSVE
jgi:phosphate transport system protein